MTATADIRFGEDSPATVQSFIRLTDSTHIQCCIYPDAAPSWPSGTGEWISRSPTPAAVRSLMTTWPSAASWPRR